MQIRNVSEADEIRSFRIRETIEMSYRDRPEFNNTTELLVDAVREPPAILTETRSRGAAQSTILLINDEMWSLNGDEWQRTEIADVPPDWTRRAYLELGTMTLVTPLDIQHVIDRATDVGAEEIDGVRTRRLNASSELMLGLLMERHATHPAPPEAPDNTPPDQYMNRYDASFWVAGDGLVLRERTVIEYTEERMHGAALGTGPVMLATTRKFFDFNGEIEIPTPGA